MIRTNPWPTPAQRLAQLRSTVQTLVSAGLLWAELSDSEQMRLGGDWAAAYERYGRTVGMWRKLYGVSDGRAAVDVARKINLISEDERHKLLRRIGEDGDEVEARTRAAVANHRLVLIPSLKEIYFDGERVDVDWSKHPKRWPCLEKLIHFAIRSRPLRRQDVCGESLDMSFLSKTFSALSNLEGFPPQLRDLIDCRRDGTAVLKIEPWDITLIADSGDR